MNPTSLPAAFRPYHQLNFCTNLLVNVAVPILIGDTPIVLVGRGKTTPMVWLAAPREPNSADWSFVLEGNQVVKPDVEIRVDAPRRALTVLVSGAKVFEVKENGKEEATVLFIDLAPLGLSVRGDLRGLSIGGMHLHGNAFQGSFAAFAFSPPAATSSK